MPKFWSRVRQNDAADDIRRNRQWRVRRCVSAYTYRQAQRCMSARTHKQAQRCMSARTHKRARHCIHTASLRKRCWYVQVYSLPTPKARAGDLSHGAAQLYTVVSRSQYSTRKHQVHSRTACSHQVAQQRLAGQLQNSSIELELTASPAGPGIISGLSVKVLVTKIEVDGSFRIHIIIFGSPRPLTVDNTRMNEFNNTSLTFKVFSNQTNTINEENTIEQNRNFVTIENCMIAFCNEAYEAEKEETHNQPRKMAPMRRIISTEKTDKCGHTQRVAHGSAFGGAELQSTESPLRTRRRPLCEASRVHDTEVISCPVLFPIASWTLVGDEHPLVWRVVYRQSRPGCGEVDTGGVHGEATVTVCENAYGTF
ncbi:unnamed protein product [Trichogramma brassicae]|uniref:Uncharacterized protein n=1 Tax=Trichogramma brassicae TaxID=86971 RepID=A0A6H5IDT3_9HYME|nr:unnamed protein product [Trichogramma brassicae]